MLDYIADADDTNKVAVAQNGHVAHAMVRHQVHHAIDTLVRGHGGHTVLHDFLHRHRPGCVAIARKCMNDFAFGNETKNCVLTRHHERANILCAEPVCRPLDAGFRSYCCDVGALPPQNAFDGHSLLPSCGLAAYLISPPQLGGMPWNPFSSTRSISISYRQEAVREHRGPRNRCPLRVQAAVVRCKTRLEIAGARI